MLCIDPACTVSCEFVGACRYVTLGCVACASRLTTADFVDTLASLPGVSGRPDGDILRALGGRFMRVAVSWTR